MGQTRAMLDMDDQNRTLWVEQPDVVITKGNRCCRGQPVTTVKQLENGSTLVFLSRLSKTSEDAMAGDLEKVFKNNLFTWQEEFSDGVDAKNYAMVTYEGEQT